MIFKDGDMIRCINPCNPIITKNEIYKTRRSWCDVDGLCWVELLKDNADKRSIWWSDRFKLDNQTFLPEELFEI